LYSVLQHYLASVYTFASSTSALPSCIVGSAWVGVHGDLDAPAPEAFLEHLGGPPAVSLMFVGKA
jgi:hypothetical protein